jgi:hypothetical protein
MLNKKMVFISVQPDVPYFHWQVEVMIHNFISVGINPSWIEVIFSYSENISDEVKRLTVLYPHINFFFYKRTIANNQGYIPILRPDSLEQHFTKFPNLKNEPVFYHDSDIIFRELPDFDKLNSDDTWYLSDTISYIGSKYIKSKSEDLFLNLCQIANIDPNVVESNESSSGGAQYLMKGVDAKFWSDVKNNCLELYTYMRDREKSERSSMSEEDSKRYNPIQKWCADMWSVLWNAWKNNHETQISKELDFSWGTSNISSYNRCKIMHNAGVTTSKDGLFYKGEFINRSPFLEDLSFVKKETTSYKYVEAILYAKEQRLKLG